MEINTKIVGIFILVFLVSGISLVASQEIKSRNADLDKVNELFADRDVMSVLVYVNEGISLEEIELITNSLDSSKIEAVYYPEGFIAEVTREEALALLRNENVDSLYQDLEIVPFLQDSVNIVGATDAWNMQYNGENLDGTGKAVCIVDTGVDVDHPDLSGKILGGGNFDCNINSGCPLNVGTSDFDGHGTHVAGIAAAAPGAGIPGGIAKGANIVSVKVFTDTGYTDEFLMKRGVAKCRSLASQYDIKAISMSIGSIELYDNYCDNFVYSQLVAEIDNSVNQGIAVVAGTGNNGNSASIAAPSCVQSAIPVAATDKNDNLWTSSNYNSIVNLFAPGVGITSTRSQHDSSGSGSYVIKSGTSMSTPMVSASIVMIQEALSLSGNSLSVSEIRELFFNSAEEINGLNPLSWRRINVNNAILALNLPPIVTLLQPADNSFVQTSTAYRQNSDGTYTLLSAGNVEFSCNAQDETSVTNIKLYVWNEDSDLVYEESRDIGGNGNSNDVTEEFDVSSVNFEIGNHQSGSGYYSYNCEVTDVQNNIVSAEDSFEFYLNHNVVVLGRNTKRPPQQPGNPDLPN